MKALALVDLGYALRQAEECGEFLRLSINGSTEIESIVLFQLLADVRGLSHRINELHDAIESSQDEGASDA